MIHTFTKEQFAAWCIGRMSYSESDKYFLSAKRNLDGVYYYTCEFKVDKVNVIIYLQKSNNNVQIGDKFVSISNKDEYLYVDIFKNIYNENPFNYV